MNYRSHKPPSKIRYDQAHPTVSIRVTQPLYKELTELRKLSGKSLGDILREALGKQVPTTRKAYQKGYEAAQLKYAILFKCTVCGGDLVLESEEDKNMVIQFMSTKNLQHLECIGKMVQPRLGYGG